MAEIHATGPQHRRSHSANLKHDRNVRSCTKSKSYINVPSHRCGHYPSTRVVFQVESILIPTVYISTGVPPAYSPIHAGVIHSEYQPVRGSCHSPRGRLSLLQSRKCTGKRGNVHYPDDRTRGPTANCRGPRVTSGYNQRVILMQQSS